MHAVSQIPLVHHSYDDKISWNFSLVTEYYDACNLVYCGIQLGVALYGILGTSTLVLQPKWYGARTEVDIIEDVVDAFDRRLAYLWKLCVMVISIVLMEWMRETARMLMVGFTVLNKVAHMQLYLCQGRK